MSDYLLHNRDRFRGVSACELGGGVGLVAIVLAAIGASRVWLTDSDTDALALAERSLAANVAVVSDATVVRCRALDWFIPLPPALTAATAGDGPRAAAPSAADGSRLGERFAWAPSDRDPWLSTTLLVASDVIYDADATRALFATLHDVFALLPRSVLLLALEKRYNFELASLSVEAHGYQLFLDQLCLDDAHFDIGARPCPVCPSRPVRFKARRLAVTHPPLVAYSRTEELELWEVHPMPAA